MKADAISFIFENPQIFFKKIAFLHTGKGTIPFEINVC